MSLGRDARRVSEPIFSVQVPAIIVSNDRGESETIQNGGFTFKQPDIDWRSLSPEIKSGVTRYLVFLSDTMKSFSENLELRSPDHLELAIAVMDELTKKVTREIEKLLNEKQSRRTINSSQFSLIAYQKNGMFGYSFSEGSSALPVLSPGQR